MLLNVSAFGCKFKLSVVVFIRAICDAGSLQFWIKLKLSIKTKLATMFLDKLIVCVVFMVGVLFHVTFAVECYKCNGFDCGDPFECGGVETCTDVACHKIYVKQSSK